MGTKINNRIYKRFTVLNLLYEVCEAKTDKVIDLQELAAKENIINGIFEEIYAYLIAEGLVKARSYKYSVIITHEGVKAIELANIYPAEKTDYFPSLKTMGIE